MIALRKIRVNDYAPIVRAIYAEETPEFLNQYHQQAGNGLDACVDNTVTTISTSRFFKVEDESGALVGLFATENINGTDVMPSFHVRKIYRTSEYLQAFWQLVTETFNNSFLTSVGAINYPALTHLLKNDFEVVNQLQYDGKNWMILKKYI